MMGHQLGMRKLDDLHTYAEVRRPQLGSSEMEKEMMNSAGPRGMRDRNRLTHHEQPQ